MIGYHTYYFSVTKENQTYYMKLEFESDKPLCDKIEEDILNIAQLMLGSFLDGTDGLKSCKKNEFQRANRERRIICVKR